MLVNESIFHGERHYDETIEQRSTLLSLIIE